MSLGQARQGKQGRGKKHHGKTQSFLGQFSFSTLHVFPGGRFASFRTVLHQRTDGDEDSFFSVGTNPTWGIINVYLYIYCTNHLTRKQRKREKGPFKRALDVICRRRLYLCMLKILHPHPRNDDPHPRHDAREDNHGGVVPRYAPVSKDRFFIYGFRVQALHIQKTTPHFVSLMSVSSGEEEEEEGRGKELRQERPKPTPISPTRFPCQRQRQPK